MIFKQRYCDPKPKEPLFWYYGNRLRAEKHMLKGEATLFTLAETTMKSRPRALMAGNKIVLIWRTRSRSTQFSKVKYNSEWEVCDINKKIRSVRCIGVPVAFFEEFISV
eukprot:TRINITY_DN4210_c0_g1_i1.p1 TRINITY_DN4210_c0_g1~~TRINITY_DN4210_c0_g1_i1.p1  ORF type:complete len:109 (-),score=12.67 TRINITY_DN4210_c0_g1_i1:39-365(-)